MSGAGRCEPPTEELTPLHVAAARGCRRCLELLLRKRGDPELRDQDGKRAIELALEHDIPRGWPPTQDPAGARRSLSFLTEDGTEGSISPGPPEDDSLAGPLSSTRRSLLEELELGGGCGLGEPLLWRGCPPSLSIPSFAPQPPMDPGGSALLPQPLASSTLLLDGDELGEGPWSQITGGRMGGPPWALPEPSAGDNVDPSPQQKFGPGGSLSSPQPQCGGRVPGEHGVSSPRAPHLRGGLSGCSTMCQCLRDGDILGDAAQHCPGVPRGPATGWAGLGFNPLAVPNLGTTALEVGAGGLHRSSLGNSSGDSELFVTAVETLEPSEASGGPGAQHHCAPQPKVARGLELGKAPVPTGAGARELPPTSPLNAEQMQGEDFCGDSRAAPCCKGGPDVGDVGELLVQLQGCSLGGSPPCTPGPLCSPASLATGDVTPRDQESPRHLHITPRTKSRLQAYAAKLSTSSSSSSLFDETLEMPRRPPRLKTPRGVPRDPATTSGHCVTPWGGDGEGTTGSLDDTEILPRAPSKPPEASGASSNSSSSPTVLLVPGDHGHPQDSPLDARGSPGCSPTVLLVPGDHGHPQDSPLDAQGSPGSSPTVLLVPGDHGHPQDSPLGAQGSSHVTSSTRPGGLEGGAGWQDPSPLGTRQPPWPHGSSSHLLAPWPSGNTVVELGSSAVLLSRTSCSTRYPEEHLKEEEQGQAPGERHSPGTETTSPEDTVVWDRPVCPVPPRPLSDETLRRRLRALGDAPGPITELTRRLYLRRLEKLVRGPRGRPAGHSPELAAALRTGHIPDCAQDELVLAQQFDRPDRSQHWREGLVKSSFNYLLLDPRTTQNLPLRSHRLSPAECFRTFVKAIFYVGKGTRARPCCHFAEALSQHRAGTQKGCPKVRRILEIWASGQGIILVCCFQNRLPAEAYTRESCLVEALGLPTITNQRKGNCYGVTVRWPVERRRRLGVHMLHRAMSIFLAEGERQLWPLDIQGGR